MNEIDRLQKLAGIVKEDDGAPGVAYLILTSHIGGKQR